MQFNEQVEVSQSDIYMAARNHSFLVFVLLGSYSPLFNHDAFKNIYTLSEGITMN